MISPRTASTGVLVVVLALFGLSAYHGATALEKKRYRLQAGSQLYLKGTSNVNAFTCHCRQDNPAQVVEVQRQGSKAKFNQAELHLQVGNFDCGNRKIEHDLQKALRAQQHPTIRVLLLDTRQDSRCLEGDCTDWFEVRANVQITIAQTTRQHTIAAQAKRLGANQFQLRGEQPLLMSDFGIEPPEAMFGMIKVRDAITFHFDLRVAVENVL